MRITHFALDPSLRGVRDEHYEAVIAALLQTFSETLTGAFTPEAQKAWGGALEFVAETMKRGAARRWRL